MAVILFGHAGAVISHRAVFWHAEAQSILSFAEGERRNPSHPERAQSIGRHGFLAFPPLALGDSQNIGEYHCRACSHVLPRRGKTLRAKPCHLAWLFSTRKARNFRNCHSVHFDSTEHRFAMGGCHGTCVRLLPFSIPPQAIGPLCPPLHRRCATLISLRLCVPKNQLLCATQNNLYLLQHHTHSHYCSPLDSILGGRIF